MTSMGIVLKKVRIKNFRSIREVEIELNDNTILFGRNNSGKSNLLSAINSVFSKVRLEKEDVFFSSDCPYSEDKVARVDLLFSPIDENGMTSATFNNQWVEILGTLIGYDGVDGTQFFGIMTIFSYDKDIGDYRRIRKRIRDWSNTAQSTGEFIPEKVMDHFDCIYVDAQRDISQDISDRHSFWNNRISKMDMSAELKTEYSEKIKQLNNSIIDNNPALKIVRDNLNDIIFEGEVTIDLIPEDLSKLHRGLEIGISNDGTIIPISNMGLGTRSQAVFSSIRTITNTNIDDSGLIIYCIILAEEPESHLHPSLQRLLVREFNCMKSQRMITTHSPFFVSESDIMDLICCSHDKTGSTYSCLKDSGMSDGELEPLRRVFIERKADALFSDVIVLGEGETEVRALSYYFENYFKKSPDQMNVVIVNVGGFTDYKPFLVACRVFNIKWTVFSDGEEKVVRSLKKSIDDVFGENAYNESLDKNVFVLPNDCCYEDYLIREGYSDIIRSALMSEDTREQFENQIKNMEDKYTDLNENELLSKVLKIKKNKTEYAKPIAKAICDDGPMPKTIIQLMESINELLGETI